MELCHGIGSEITCETVKQKRPASFIASGFLMELPTSEGLVAFCGGSWEEYTTHLYLPPRSTGRQSCTDQRKLKGDERRDFNLLIQTGSKPPHISDGFKLLQGTNLTHPQAALKLRRAEALGDEATKELGSVGRRAYFKGKRMWKSTRFGELQYVLQIVTVCIPWSQFSINHNWYLAVDTARLEFGPQMLTRFDPCRGRKIVLLCTFLLFALPVHPVQLQQSFVLIIFVGTSMGQKLMLKKTRKLIGFVSKPIFEARLMQNPMAIRPSPQAALVRNGLPSPVKWNAPGKHWKATWPWQPSRKNPSILVHGEASRYSWMMLDVHPKKCPFLVLDLIVFRHRPPVVPQGTWKQLLSTSPRQDLARGRNGDKESNSMDTDPFGHGSKIKLEGPWRTPPLSKEKCLIRW